MPRTQQIIHAFKNGEVAPSLKGRQDTEQYPYFLEALENMIVHKHGGAFTRGGCHFVLETKYPERDSRLIPFVFSASQSYVLEFGDRYMRVFRNSGYLQNIQGVRSFIGDGTSTKYLYPFPGIAEADIEIRKNGVVLTEGVDYTVQPADIVSNLIEDFTNVAAWDVNYDDGEGAADDPWVLAANTASSPVGSEPVLRQQGINIARGSLIDFTFDIDAFAYTEKTDTDTHDVVVPLIPSDPYITIANVTMPDDNVDDEIFIDYTFAIEDQSAQSRTSDFFWELRHNDKILDEDVVLQQGSPAQVINITGVVLEGGVKAGDKISLHVRAIGNNLQSAPAIPGDVSSTVLNVHYRINPLANLKVWTMNGLDEEAFITVDHEAIGAGGTYELLDREVVNHFPLRLKMQTDNGLEITISNPSVINKRDGWEIIFTDPPAISDVIIILDGSSVPDETSAELQGDLLKQKFAGPKDLTDEVYEIESPFTAEQLDDLYYTQANDQMFLCHYAHKPWRLTRYNAYDWRFEQPEFVGAPWEDAQYSPAYGYPRCVVFFHERLWFASTLKLPQTFWGSRSADFYEFTLPGENDPYKPDDPVEYTLASYTQETIEWFSSERILIIGTAATEHRLDPDQYISVDRLPQVSKMTTYGGAHQLPIYLGDLTCYVQKSGRQIRSFRQKTDSITEAYESISLGWMAEHLFEIAIKEPAYALLPHAYAVMVRLDGIMLNATYDPSSAQGSMHDLGWGRMITDGKFKSCCVIPEEYAHQVWVITEREIDDVNNPGETIAKRYVEYLDDSNYLDSVLTYPPDETYPPTTTVGNLDHLEGKSVSILADGAVHPERVVQNGEVTLDYEASVISAGLPFKQRLKMMPFEGGNPGGTSQGKQKRWIQIWANLLDSANPRINGKRPPSRTPSTPMDTVEPLKTGAVRSINVGFDRTGQIEIEQDLPLYLHILNLYGDYETASL